jgi:hypothetical protein
MHHHTDRWLHLLAVDTRAHDVLAIAVMVVRINIGVHIMSDGRPAATDKRRNARRARGSARLCGRARQ